MAQELKTMTVIDAYQLECNDNDLVCLKSEVDAILAEKDNEIAELKEDKLTLMQRLNVLGGKFFGLSQSYNIEISKCGSLERLVAELKAENKRLDDLAHEHNLELLRKENLIDELRETNK